MTIRTLYRILWARTVCRLRMKFNFKTVGEGSFMYKPSRIIGGENVAVGKDVSIMNGLRLETYKTNYKLGRCMIDIGDNTGIEQNVHITAGESIVIGRECSIMGGCCITDITHPHDDINVSPKNREIICNPVVIGDQCLIGMHTYISPGVMLGRHVTVGANSVVTKSFPDNCVVAGVPARIIKKYCPDRCVWEKSD